MAADTATPSTRTTREQIVRVARNLIQSRSYLGFSFQDVANEVGIRKASLYHHFPTKEALGVEVLRESTQAFKNWSMAQTGSPQAALDAYFKMYRDALHAGERVCPAGGTAPAPRRHWRPCTRRCGHRHSWHPGHCIGPR